MKYDTKNTLNIIFFAGIEWSFLKQGQQYLAEIFAELGMNVIYIEPILHRRPRINDFSKIWRRLSKAFGYSKHKINTPKNLNVKILSPLALPDTNHIFRWLNSKIFLPSVVRNCRREMLCGDVISYIWWPIPAYTELIDLLQPAMSVYSCVDNHAAMVGCPSWLPSTEIQIVESADLIVVTSEPLFRKWKRSAKKIHLRPRSVNYSLFSLANTGPTKTIERLIFFGGISSRIDFTVINAIANVGYLVDLYGEWRVGYMEMHTNVTFHGLLLPTDLPKIIGQYDAILWPYHLDKYTSGILPAKLYECMASGKPVFSTALPALESLGHLGLYLGESSEHLISLLSNFDPERDEAYYKVRTKSAAEHSWENSAEKEIKLIRKFIKYL